MGLLSFVTALFPLFASCPTEVSGPILYALHRGEAERAFVNYLDYIKEGNPHDFDLLQQAAKALLEQGISSKDAEIKLMCVFGAGVATSSELLHILEKGIRSDDLRIQLVALSYLGRQEDDEADRILLDALSSPFLITRLEALLQLAKKNHPAVLEHLYSLTVKVPDEVRAVFSQIAVYLEGSDAARYMHRLLTDPEMGVRVETLLAAAEAGRDDYLAYIRPLAFGASSAQQEATAVALGELKDYSSLARLKVLATSNQEGVALSSSISLYLLGEYNYLEPIIQKAKKGSLFAIAALGKLREGQETLFELLSHLDRDVRLNATLSLLVQNDSRVLAYLPEILLEDKRDLGFFRITSAGGGLTAWKTISSASQHTKAYPGLAGQTLTLREKMLTQCIDFEEEEFLKMARLIIDKKQHTLVPLLIELVQNRKSEAIIQFLREGHQKAGAPLIRNYCTLALYRLSIEGPYEEQLIAWVKARGGTELIRFREEEEEGMIFNGPHELTPEETSRFLVETCETLASAQNLAGIEALIHAIAYGNPKNRYALAGLLLRTTE